MYSDQPLTLQVLAKALDDSFPASTVVANTASTKDGLTLANVRGFDVVILVRTDKGTPDLTP